jgi:hypothetical protein
MEGVSKTLLCLNYIVCIHEDLSGHVLVIVVHYYYAFVCSTEIFELKW